MTVFEEGSFETLDSEDSTETFRENRTKYRQVLDCIVDAKITVGASLGLLAVNLIYGDSLQVNTSDPLSKQLEMAIPSAFGTPDATGVAALDFAGVSALTLASLEMARRTTSLPELGAIAVSAQLAGSGADAIVDQTGFIGNTIDVGSSAVAVAWTTKFLLDRTAAATDETERRRWKLGMAAFAGAMTLGAYVLLGGDDGKLDVISHCSAFVIGGVAYRFGSWRKNITMMAEKSIL